MTTLVERAVGWRHGVVADVGRVPTALSDVALPNWSAEVRPMTGESPAGGMSVEAAIGEAVERYCAAMCPLPAVSTAGADVLPLDCFTLHSASQRRARGFPFANAYAAPGPFTTVYSALDNRPWAAPVSLVTLDPARTMLATSSGLAADPSPVRALLRAVQELVERDAFMSAWLHSLGPGRVAQEDDVAWFDITPAYSPHPVAAVAGCLPQRGRPRLSLGLACRSRWDDAAEKAHAEWAQGVLFAGLYRGWFDVEDVTDFDRHAAYYTLHPDRWGGLPWWQGPVAATAPDAAVVGSPASELRHLVETLAGNGVRVFYRDLTTVDAAAIGLRVVRALSPDLTPIHGDHRWPFLGGATPDVQRRFPGVRATRFPNPNPHPLG